MKTKKRKSSVAAEFIQSSILSFLMRHVEFFKTIKMPKFPTHLWHYTSTSGLIEIINNNSLRATHIRFLNDPSEGEGMFSQFRTSLEEIFKSRQGKVPSSFLMSVKKSQDDLINRIYVTSFTRLGNSLPMWHNYGKSDGYSMKLEIDNSKATGIKGKVILQNAKDPNGFTQLFLPVIYNNSEQIKIIDFFAEEIYSFIKSVFSNKPILELSKTHSEIFNRPLNFIMQQANSRLATFKADTHSHEFEYRNVIIPMDQSYQEKFIARDGIICPYIEYEIEPCLPISEIMVGPKINDNIALLGLSKLLKSKSYNEDIISKSGIAIRY